jgi:predicted nucleic acid-binding protein
MLAATPTLLFWVALRLLPGAFERLSERRKVRRAQQQPAGPTIEAAVANLRRLRRDVCGHQQPNQVRQLALAAAYDATLIEVCHRVGVDAPLATADGPDRAFARLLTEAALEEAGIALDPPGGKTAAA